MPKDKKKIRQNAQDKRRKIVVRRKAEKKLQAKKRLERYLEVKAQVLEQFKMMGISSEPQTVSKARDISSASEFKKAWKSVRKAEGIKVQGR